MKFSQFLELEEILKENNHTIEDLKEQIKKDPESEELYEFFGINKALLSWGVKTILSRKLKNKADKFVKDVRKSIIKSIQKLVTAKREVEGDLEELEKMNKPIPKETRLQIFEIEKNIIRIVNGTIDKLARIKTQEVDSKIEGSKKLKESAKLGLKYLWEKLMVDAKVELLTELLKQKVLETAAAKNFVEKFATKSDDKLKEMAKRANKEIEEIRANSGEKSKSGEPAEGEKIGAELT